MKRAITLSVCAPACGTVRKAWERPADPFEWTRAELYLELQRVAAERKSALETLRDATDELLGIPKWLRRLFQAPSVRQLRGRR